ncbi:HISTONE H1-LIKE [Salix purpurea]|uniref:HISTONE H1-LIKE n=1 Tax=Salix purpurea TaxID=77065 RepID=A0A9Q0VIN3_SALPP|nr:HISTONE H1-LIKE [Salix purpurea]
MDPPPPSLSIPPPAPPSIPPPQPATVTTTITPTPTTNETPHLAPPPLPTSTISLPSYAEMIYSAITALKEQDGSSRIAIAKYIERAYPGLPANHSDLLTHHLKRLKNSGALVLNKKSYMLPRSDNNTNISDATTTTATVSNNPPQIQPQLQQQHPQHVVPVTSAPPEQKRGRGRPPKTKANGLPPTPPMLANGQPQTGLGSHVSVTSQTQSQLVGIPADPASTGRKGRGRSKKVVVTEAGPLVKKGRGRPPNSGSLGSKKSTGRPRKPKSLVGAKKSPGRPPKNQLKPVNVPYAVAAPTATDAAAVFSVASPKPRGRPRKGATPTASATGAVVMVQAKQPGRPAQVPGVMKLKPRKSSGRPVGRPRKVNAVNFTRIRV